MEVSVSVVYSKPQLMCAHSILRLGPLLIALYVMTYSNAAVLTSERRKISHSIELPH